MLVEFQTMCLTECFEWWCILVLLYDTPKETALQARTLTKGKFCFFKEINSVPTLSDHNAYRKA
jgi:hypothetical protein